MGKDYFSEAQNLRGIHAGKLENCMKTTVNNYVVDFKIAKTIYV